MELILRVWAGSQEVGLEAKEVGLVAKGWGW